MNKQANPNWMVFLLFAALVVTSPAFVVRAQNNKSTDFKAGNRVEGRIGSKWKQCTVVGHRATGGYTLRCDDKPLEESVFAASDVRAMQTPDNDGGKRVAEEAKKTVAQAIAQCAGEPLLDLRTKGRAASAELFRNVIKAFFDREAQGGLHKHVTTFENLEVGKPYRWQPGTDGQRLGQAKTVYPVKASFVTCDDGPYDWGIAEYKDYNFSCYVDETRNGEWSCGVNESGTIKSRRIPKQSSN
jgi:hypothetical protein